MKEKFLNSLKLFLIFFKIGLFTFGGGYGMIGIIQDEVVEKRKWITKDEFFEIIIISESTPGPIAVNMATYIGYKVSKFLGATLATIGLAIPSMVIIYVVSLFYKEFLQFEIVQKIFKGLNVGVIILLLSTIFKLAKEMKKDAQFYIVFSLAFVVVTCFTIFLPKWPWITFILISIGLILGIINTAIANRSKGGKK